MNPLSVVSSTAGAAAACCAAAVGTSLDYVQRLICCWQLEEAASKRRAAYPQARSTTAHHVGPRLRATCRVSARFGCSIA